MEPLEARLLLDGGQVQGLIWEDIDADGLRGNQEAGADGIIVELIDADAGLVLASAISESRDDDGDGQIDPLSESGRYRFTAVPAGRYEIRAQVPQGWLQTAPPMSFLDSRSEDDSLYHPNRVSLDFIGTPAPASDATLTISAVADLDGTKEYLRILADGTQLAYVFVEDGQQYQPVQTVIDVPQADLEPLAADGTISITVQPSLAVDDLGGSESLTVELAYVSTGRHVVELDAGQVVEAGAFGLAPPLSNAAPVLTAVETLTGAVEDVPFVITYEALSAAADEADADGQPVTFRVEIVSSGALTKAGEPAGPGVTLLGPAESLTWLPPADAHGTLDAFRVRAWDGLAKSVMPVQVSVQVQPVNDAPTLTSIATLTGAVEGEPFVIAYDALSAAGDAADADGDTILFRVESVVSGALTKAGEPVTPGVTLLGAGESLTWLADPDACGTLEAFQVVAWDGQAASAEAVGVPVRLAGQNHPPTLTTIETLTGATEDVSFPISYAALAAAGDAADADGQEIHFRVELASSGALTKAGQPVRPGETLLGPGERITWWPAPDAHGVLGAFAVVAWDGQAASAVPVEVTVAVAPVNDAPAAMDDTAETDEDTPLTTDGVLDNDTDADGDSLTVEAFTQPSHGSAAYNGDGTFSYVPAADFYGQDEFAYTVSDGRGGQDTATVVITVAAVNDPPLAADDAAATHEGTPVTTPDVLENDTDADGDSLTVEAFTQPSHGSAAYNGDGTFTYAPEGGFRGTDSFTYTVGDGGGGQDAAAVFVTVAGVGGPPAPADDAVSTSEDTPVTTGDVLANDAGDALTVVGFSQPLHGSAAYNGDGSFTYAPAANFNGIDRFTYTAADANGAEAAAAVVVTVAPVNDPPHADAQSRLAYAGEPTWIFLTGSDLESGDEDLSFAIVTQPAHGTVSLSGGTALYVSDGYVGADAFTFTVTDAGETTQIGTSPPLSSAPATVSLTLATPLTAVSISAGRSDVLTYTDADGTTVRLRLRRGGSAKVHFDGQNVQYQHTSRGVVVTGDGLFLRQIALADTTARSSLTIKTDRGGDGRAEVGGIAAHGPLRNLTGRSTDLTGDLIVDGPLRKLAIGDAAGVWIGLNVANAPVGPRDAVRVTFDRVAECVLETHGLPIRSLKAAEWIDADDADDAIRAPWIGRLAIKGRRGNDRKGVQALAGDFGADLILSGRGDPRRPVLGKALVAGSVRRASWLVAGQARGVKIAGDVEAWTFQPVAVRSLALGDVHSAEVLVADVLGRAKVLRWADGRIEADQVGSLSVTGRRGRPGRCAAVDGDFGAAVVVHGRGVPDGKWVLRSARIAGDLTGSVWHVAGGLGKLAVSGAAEGSTIRAGGSISSVTLGAAIGSDILAGVAETGRRHAETPADFENPSAEIRSLQIRGWKVPSGESVPRFLADSNFSAATFGVLRLLNADAGTALGLFALGRGGDEIGSLRYRDTVTGESWTWRPGEPLPAVGNLTVNILG